MTTTIFGARSNWCALCHNPPSLCMCERDSAGVLDLFRVLDADYLRSLLIAARAGCIEHRGVRYALTWVDYE